MRSRRTIVERVLAFAAAPVGHPVARLDLHGSEQSVGVAGLVLAPRHGGNADDEKRQDDGDQCEDSFVGRHDHLGVDFNRARSFDGSPVASTRTASL